MPDAYVTQFICSDFVEKLTGITIDCENDSHYNKTKFIDCHCKSEEKFAAMATLRESYIFFGQKFGPNLSRATR